MMDYFEIIASCDPKSGLYSILNEYMKDNE